MNTNERITLIKQRLEQKFTPTKLEVIDDSDKHKGHPGSAGGAGHYTIIITADCFVGKTRINIHREIYDVLNDLIPHEIHALQIKLLSRFNTN